MAETILTPEQKRVVGLADGPYLLTAPPGSGKTEVLVQRVIRLLRNTPDELFRILGLTYTNRAAGELRTRVTQVVEQDDRWRVNASTFHSFCLDLLENYGEAIGLSKPITVFDDNEDRRNLLIEALGGITSRFYNVDNKAWNDLFASISRLKVDLVPPRGAPETLVLNGYTTLKDAYDAYEVALTNVGGIDFDGMIFRAVELLNADPWVRRNFLRSHRYLVVDEGQEMTRAQYTLLRTLAGEDFKNILIVADSDQSINSFAGGGPEFLRKFEEDFEAQRFWLSTNFRCARHIVASSKNLATRIESRSPSAPVMESSTLAPGFIDARGFRDEQAEAEAVVSWLANLIRHGLPQAWLYEGEDRRLAAEEACIIGRTRYAFDHVINEMSGQKIPHLVRTEEGALFDSFLGKLTLYALRLALNPRDIPSTRRFLAVLPESFRDEVAQESKGNGLIGLVEAIENSGEVPTEWTRTIRAVSSGNSSMDDLIVSLASIHGQDEDGVIWETDVERLKSWWASYSLTTRKSDRNLESFMRHLTQMQKSVRDETGVRILTPYRARGLGFKVVVLLGMNEGTFPFYKAASSQEIDEERRAVYVAASRAARALLITRPRIRYNRWGREFHEHRSRFITEMGLEVRET